MMNEELGMMLRAIQENPADDLARDAYADLCEGAGDGQRAEFIRVQCELSRIGPRRRQVQAFGVTVRRSGWEIECQLRPSEALPPLAVGDRVDLCGWPPTTSRDNDCLGVVILVEQLDQANQRWLVRLDDLSTPYPVDRVTALRAQELALLDRYGSRWFHDPRCPIVPVYCLGVIGGGACLDEGPILKLHTDKTGIIILVPERGFIAEIRIGCDGLHHWPSVADQHPVTRITIYDKLPRRTRRRSHATHQWTWWREFPGNTRPADHSLPLPFFPGAPLKNRVNYKTRAEAMQALSDHCVRLIRDRLELPPLTGQT